MCNARAPARRVGKLQRVLEQDGEREREGEWEREREKRRDNRRERDDGGKGRKTGVGESGQPFVIVWRLEAARLLLLPTARGIASAARAGFRQEY